MVDLTELLADLADEARDLDLLVADLPAARWSTPTPAPGWSIAYQIAHLAWTDETARRAVEDPDGLRAQLAGVDVTAWVEAGAARGASVDPAVLLARWRAGRTRLAAVLATVPPGVRLPWVGTDMGAASMATGRLMETWAHGQDVADALGHTRTPTSRLRHVARIGVRARDHAFAAHGLPVPESAVRVELTAPDGELWTYGPPDAAQRVVGPALDWCLVATQRRHTDDTALVATGADATAWLRVAQAFAGPPGAGRAPR
ncbi:TIGR03084 family metal-binding protein [Actinocatenispora rupis]|uniref:TIGR03084 family protein n=1 Tax=Actinocatenispora rupis TaxID=519421 RepID=A0A8J3NCH3_9ACTN|nr:TIGR03084 family metal-binding protein [Actinocatenispora rupis]GID11900.1 TIGR03084 family protein [Actinocatenispora rupis]